MKKKNKNLTSFSELLDKKYGKRGTKKREEYEGGFEVFKLGVMIHMQRKEQGMTQAQLAEKCGINKAYISRMENDASNIRFSILMKVIQKGLGGRLKFTVQF